MDQDGRTDLCQVRPMYEVGGVPLIQSATALALTLEHYWVFLATLLPPEDPCIVVMQMLHAMLHSQHAELPGIWKSA